MSRVFPLLVVLLIALTVGTKPPVMRPPGHVRDRDLPPAARKRVEALRRELQSILTEECKRLLYVIREIEWARKCIYNGLPIPEYLRTREVCKTRSETLEALREFRKTCNPSPWKCDQAEFKRLFHERQRAVAACAKIGWDGDKNCPSLRDLQAEFEKRKGACRPVAGRLREIREEIRRVKANFARPSVAPIARVAA